MALGVLCGHNGQLTSGAMNVHSSFLLPGFGSWESLDDLIGPMLIPWLG